MDVQFHGKDILDKLSEIERQPYEIRNDTLSILNHEVSGAYNSPMGMSDYILRILKMNSKIKKQQNAYVENVLNMLRITHDNHAEIIKLTRKKHTLMGMLEKEGELMTENIKEYVAKELKEIPEIISSKTKGITGTLESMVEYHPLTANVEEIQQIGEKNKKILETVDYLIENLVYMLNAHYSPDFKRDAYDLKNDVDALYIMQQMIDGKKFPKMEKPNLHHVISPHDYVKEAISVYKKNIYEHAFNPKNDIYKRRKEKDFRMTIEIESVDDDNEKQIRVFVKDNGFGVKDGIKLFERGASSKTDKSTEHGIGLWSVKNAVEKYGGKVGYMTVKGKGTTLFFTIPYDRKENDQYILDKKD